MGTETSRAEIGNRRLQFTLGTLMGMMAAVSLLLGMWAWRGALGALQFCLGAAVCVTAVGVYRRRSGLIAAGLLLAGAMLYALFYSARNTTITSGSGRVTAVLAVTVADAATGEPIPRASVSLSSWYEAPRPVVVAGDDGVAEAAIDVWATVSGYRSVLVSRDETFLPTRHLILEAKADGYEAVTKPLSEYLGPESRLSGERFPPITMELVRKPQEKGQSEP